MFPQVFVCSRRGCTWAGGVYPSMHLGRGVCIPACIWIGVWTGRGVDRGVPRDWYCSGQYASNWNAYLYKQRLLRVDHPELLHMDRSRENNFLLQTNVTTRRFRISQQKPGCKPDVLHEKFSISGILGDKHFYPSKIRFISEGGTNPSYLSHNCNYVGVGGEGGASQCCNQSMSGPVEYAQSCCETRWRETITETTSEQCIYTYSGNGTSRI